MTTSVKISSLTLYVPMEFPIKFDIKSGWSIVYIEGSQVIKQKNILLSLKIYF